MNGLDFLLDPPARSFSEWSWATVSDTNPVQIRLDGDTHPLEGSPTLLVSESALSVGTRVRVHLDKSRALGQVGAHVYVFGVAGGGGGASISGTRDLPGTSGGKGGWAMRIGPILICTVRLTISPVVDEITSVTWEFPERFGAGPTVTATVRSTVGRVSRLFVYDITTTSVLVSLIRDNTTDTTVYVQAIGPAR